MKRVLSILLVLLFVFTRVSAGDWSVTLNTVSGLPGVETSFAAGDCYKFVSQVYDSGSTTTQRIRLTVLDTYNHEQPNGNNYCFALSELAVYDGNGNKISYIASSNADHNNLSWNTDGDGIYGLSDGDYGTYFHSMWASYGAVAEYHYLELSLTTPVSAFSLEWATRAGQPKNAPIKVGITLGTEYVETAVGNEFALGNAANSVEALSQGGKLFVLRSNAVKSFTTSAGVTYSGSGPIYMNCAESGTTSATFDNVVQFIPAGGDKYFIYWPSAGVYLKDCGADYNGSNGWQYSTSNLNNVAYVGIKALDSGDFEMSYITTFNDPNGDSVADSLYIAGELRDGVVSKMKTFAPDKKAALESGDYSQGFSLPAAFNWTIYEAELSDSTIAAVSMTMAKIASYYLSVPVRQSREYIAEFGDFGGVATNVMNKLETAIATAEGYMETGATPTMEQIKSAETLLSQSTSEYVGLQLNVYDARVDSILAASAFSSYPYIANTYPESSRTLLETVKTTISDTKSKTDIYTPEQLIAIYRQIDQDIERFYSTKITYSTLPLTYSSGDGLPGNVGIHSGYVWSSPLVTLNAAVTGIRITFAATSTSADTSVQTFNGYPIASLAEFELYNEEGSLIPLTANNFSTNSQEVGEGPIANICDGVLTNYWHSIWSTGTMSPEGNVYLDIEFPAPMSSFSFTMYSRSNCNFAPTEIVVSDATDISEEDVPVLGDAVYVYLADGGIDAYRVDELDGNYYVQGEYTCFPLKSGSVFYYTAQEFDSISAVAPQLPELTSYKFNNKYNHNLHVDAIAEPVTDEMSFSLNAIGKWLTASFQLSDDRAVAYIDTVRQVSKVTRQSFAAPKTYTVTYPGYNKVGSIKVQDEVWEYTDGSESLVPLTASMLSTNKPSTQANEGVGSLLDGYSSTIYHSTWGSANNATLNVDAFIAIALPTSLENFKLYYQCRPQNGYAPLELEIYASNDSADWKLVRTLTTADGLPTGSTAYATYKSPAIALGGSYSYLKILQTAGEYSKNHMALAEMRIYNVEPGDSTLVSEAVYETKRVPFGRNYKVAIDWLVDKAVSVPRIDIDIDGGATVTSKDYYLNAKFRITGYGVYDDFEDSVQIKGRGNTTWSYPKKPYRLKFGSKVKPFGLTKGKSWVLLANAQNGSMMTNAAAMKIGQMAGAEYPNHVVPVELYMNGVYKGSYMFTEKVGISNNSVDIDDALGYLLELDTYYDEVYKFYSKFYLLPANIKDPDLTEYTADAATARKELIQADFDALATALYQNEAIDTILDLDAFARFMLTNDLVCNQELGHPKSTYLFKEDLSNPDSKIKFGPLWDFDWAYGYESTRQYCTQDVGISIFKSSMSTESGSKFFKALMNNTDVQKYYYKVWTEFLGKNSIAELCDYMECYYNFAKSSFENNATVWSDGTGYAAINSRMQQWLSDRSAYLYENLTEYDLDEFLYPLMADVNNNNQVTVHDMAIVAAYRNGNSYADFTYEKADMNGDGSLDATDITAIENEILNAEFIDAELYYKEPLAIGELYVDDFAMEPNGEYILPVNVKRMGEENYKAVQFDMTLPDGVLMLDVAAGPGAPNHKVAFTQMDMTTYRVIVYSSGDKQMGTESDAFVNLSLLNYAEIPEEDCKVVITNVLAVDETTEQVRMNGTTASFSLQDMKLVGDVNGDGSVDVSDVTGAVAMILGTENLTLSADANGDGSVDVSDVTKIVSIILGTDAASAAPAKAAATRAGEVATSTVSADGDGSTLLININNPEYPFSAIQFDLELPEGIEVDFDGEYYAVDLGSRTNSRKHSYPECAIQPDGSLRVVIISMSNALYNGTEGDVATAALKVNGAADGDYQFTIKNVVLSAPGSKEKLEPYTGWINVTGGVTGISEIKEERAESNDIYDLQGRKVKTMLKNNIYIKDNRKYIAE